MRFVSVELVNGKVLYTVQFGDTSGYAFVIEDTEKNICYGTNDVMLVGVIMNKVQTKFA